jgi:hypothetical protein
MEEPPDGGGKHPMASNGYAHHRHKTNHMSPGTLLLIVLILLLIGALPTWSHSRRWGFYPSGGLGLLVIIILILLSLGHL